MNRPQIAHLVCALLALIVLPGIAWAATAPSQAEMEKLVVSTTHAWISGVRAKDMTAFWKVTAKVYRDKNPLAAEQKDWQPMQTEMIELPLPTTQRPVFDKPPVVDKNGILVAYGKLPLAPYELHFGYQWINESGKWLYLGSGIEWRALRPPDAECGKLAGSASKVLITAIKEKDAKKLIEILLPPYRPENPEQSAATFLDSTAVKKIAALPTPAKVVLQSAEIIKDDSMLLSLKGRIDAPDGPLHFNYKLFPARGGWRLAGFDFSSESFLSK